MDFLVDSVRRLSDSRKKSRSLPLYTKGVQLSPSASGIHFSSLETRLSPSSPKLGWTPQPPRLQTKRRNSSSCLPTSGQRSDTDGSPSDTTSCSSLEFLPGSSWKTPQEIPDSKMTTAGNGSRKERLEAIKARIAAERNKYKDNSSSSTDEEEGSAASKGLSRYHSDEALNRSRSRSSRTDRYLKRRSQDLEGIRHVTRSDPHLPAESRSRVSWHESYVYQEPLRFQTDSQSASEGTPTPARKPVTVPAVPHPVVKAAVMAATRKPLSISVHGLGSQFPPASPCDSGLGSHSITSSPSLCRVPTPPPRSPKAELPAGKRFPPITPETRSPTSTLQSDSSPVSWWRKKQSFLPPHSPVRTEPAFQPASRVYSYTDQAPSAYMSDSQLEPRQKHSEEFSRKLGAWKAMESAVEKGKGKRLEIFRAAVVSPRLTISNKDRQVPAESKPTPDNKEILSDICRAQRVIWPKDFSNGVSRSPVFDGSPRNSPITWAKKEPPKETQRQKVDLCTSPAKESPKPLAVPPHLWSPPSTNPRRISAAEALGVIAAVPPPPARVASLETARRSVDALVDRERRRRCSEHLEDALQELETIYQSLRLNDDDELLDRADRRDIPEFRPSGNRINHWQKRYSIADPTAAGGYPLVRSFSDNAGRLRRSAVPNKVADDFAVRKLVQTPTPPRSKVPIEAATSPSYLLCSPAFTPSLSVEPATRDVTCNNEPDPELDDVGYRKFAQSSRYMPPHPPFGIPLEPSPKSPPSSYLFTESDGTVPDWRSSKKKTLADPVRDDLAYRNLRRESLFNPGSRRSVSVLSDLEEWTRPLRPLPAASKSEDSMADIIAALERLGQRSPPPVPKRRSVHESRASGFCSDNQTSFSSKNQDAFYHKKPSNVLNNAFQNESKHVISLQNCSAPSGSRSASNPFPTFTSSFSMMNDASSKKNVVQRANSQTSAKSSPNSKATAEPSMRLRASTDVARPPGFSSSNGLEASGGSPALDDGRSERINLYKDERRRQLHSKLGDKVQAENAFSSSPESSFLRRSLRLKDKDAINNTSSGSGAPGFRRFITRDQQSSDTDPSMWAVSSGTETAVSDMGVRSTRSSRLRAQVNVPKSGEGLQRQDSLHKPPGIISHSQVTVSNQSSTDHNENFTERKTFLQRVPSQKGGSDSMPASTTESDNSSEPGGAKFKDKSAKRKSNLNRANVLEEVIRPPATDLSLERRNRRLRRGSDSSHTSGSDKNDIRTRRITEASKKSSTDSQSDSKASISSVLRKKSFNERDTEFRPECHSSPRRKVTALKKPEIPDVLKRTTSPTVATVVTSFNPNDLSSQGQSFKDSPLTDSRCNEIEDSRCYLSSPLNSSLCLSSDKPSDDSYHSVSQAPDTELEDSFGTPPETLSRPCALPESSIVYTLSVITKSTPYNSEQPSGFTDAVNLTPLTSLLEEIEVSRPSFVEASNLELIHRLTSPRILDSEGDLVKGPVPILKRKSLEEDRKEDIQGILKVRTKAEIDEEYRRPPSILKKRGSSEEKEFESTLLNPIFRKYALEEYGSTVHSILKTKSLEDNTTQPRPILKRGSVSEENACDTTFTRCVEIPRPILKKKSVDEDSALEEKPRPILKTRLSQEDMSEGMRPRSDSSDSGLLRSILRKSSMDQDLWSGRKDQRRNSDDILSDSSLNLLRSNSFGFRRGSDDLTRPLAPASILKRSLETLDTVSVNKGNATSTTKASGSASGSTPRRAGGLRVSDGVVPSVRERFDRRNTPRYRTQPITQVEVQETDNLESVQAFRTLITTNASVFERPVEEEEVEKSLSDEASKREYPQRYRPDRKKDRRTNSRYRTLPITLETPLEDVSNNSGLSAVSNAATASTSSSSDEMSGLSVMAKASLFQKKALDASVPAVGRRSSEVRNRFLMRRMMPRSQTQPITEEEVHEAAKIVDGDIKLKSQLKENSENKEEKTNQIITKYEEKTSKESAEDSDPSKLSLAEKMRLFNQKMQEESLQKAPMLKGPSRRRSSGQSRFQTQPITTEEVRKVRHSFGGLATALKPPEPEEEEVKEALQPSSSLWKTTVQREAEKRVQQTISSERGLPLTVADDMVAKTAATRNRAASDVSDLEKPAVKDEADGTKVRASSDVTSRGRLLADLRKQQAKAKDSEAEAPKATIQRKEESSVRSRTSSEVTVKTSNGLPTESRIKSSSDTMSKSTNGVLSDTNTKKATEKSTEKRGEEESSSSSSDSEDDGSEQRDSKSVLTGGQSHLVFYSPGQGPHGSRRNIPNQAIQRKLNANLRRKEERRLHHPEVGKVFQSSLSSPALEVPSLSPASSLKGEERLDSVGHLPIKRSQTQPMPPKGSNETGSLVEGGSIKDRLAALQRSGTEDWQKRLFQSPESTTSISSGSPKAGTYITPEDSPPEENGKSAIASRLSQLQRSSEQWRHRVEEKDAAQFTVAGKMAVSTTNSVPPNGTSPLLERKTKKVPLPFKSPLTGRKLQHPNAVAVLPLGLSKSKSMPEALGLIKKEASSDEEEEEEEEKKGRRVLIPKADNETFSSFFHTPSFISGQVISEETFHISTETLDQVTSQTQKLLVQHRKIPVQKRRHVGSRNPIRALSSRSDFQQQEYLEVTSTGVAQKELRRMQVEQLAKTSDKCLSALAGLASTEDFKNVALKKGGEGSGALLPTHSLMLVQVKGRRHVQTRLVQPCLSSINQGDSYLLVTPTKVFCWIGAYTNVIEKAKVSEVSSIVQLKKDLCFRGSCQLITIDLEKEMSNENPNNNKEKNAKDQEEFYSLLGSVKPGDVELPPPGTPEEDELYEAAIIGTNSMYLLEGDALVPCKEFWGNLPKVEALQADTVAVFDFGSEMYVWKGKQSTQTQRTLGVTLAKELWEKGYDYSECNINPIDSRIITDATGTCQEKKDASPNNSSSSVCAAKNFQSNSDHQSAVRPEWCIFAPINQHMEPVLFREKFLDWPDTSRLIKVKGQEDETDASAKPKEDLKACNAQEMLEQELTEPGLVLEGQNIGRGIEWNDSEERRFFEITNQEVNVWHILEYESRRLPLVNGQLHSGDTYVVRWRYKVTQKGRNLHGEISRHSFTGRVRCAYFFWQGQDSSITEKGASALMTVELNEERGPHVRVNQGKEPPCFLNLFEGRMIIYRGERENDSTNIQGPWKLFVVRGQFPDEVFLLEVLPSVGSLRSRASFLLVNCKTGIIFVWHGSCINKKYKDIARHAAQNLLATPPEEMLFGPEANLVITEMDQGSETNIFRSALSTDDSSWNRDKPTVNYEIETSSPRLFHLSSVSGIFKANEILCTYRSTHNPCLLPFIQEDIYSVRQPALFLLEPSSGGLYLWQGWQPEGDEETSNVATGSAAVRWNNDRRCAMQTALDYAKAKSSEGYPEVLLVTAGLEPKSFTDLFPEWQQREDVTALNLQEGKQGMGECLNVSEVLRQLTRTHYSLEELQALPPPEGVNPKNLEKYLTDEDFQDILKLSKDEFYGLPKWKQDKLKKEVQLF